MTYTKQTNDIINYESEQNFNNNLNIDINKNLNETLYEEIFEFLKSSNENVKKESLDIILGLIENTDFINFIKKNDKKYLKLIISNLQTNNHILATECLMNLSTPLAKQIIERNVIELLFDFIKSEENNEINYIDMYIMILSNLTRCKEGINKLCSNSMDNENLNNPKAITYTRSYYLETLLKYFFKPIERSINKNINDKYLCVINILVNFTSIKENALYFNDINILNKLSEQLLIIERFKVMLSFITNLCLNDLIYENLFNDKCNIFPYILSYIYTKKNNSRSSKNEDIIQFKNEKNINIKKKVQSTTNIQSSLPNNISENTTNVNEINTDIKETKNYNLNDINENFIINKDENILINLSSQNINNQNKIHELTLLKANKLIDCSIIKNRILIILWYLCKHNVAKNKLINLGIYKILENWIENEKDTTIKFNVENIINHFKN